MKWFRSNIARFYDPFYGNLYLFQWMNIIAMINCWQWMRKTRIFFSLRFSGYEIQNNFICNISLYFRSLKWIRQTEETFKIHSLKQYRCSIGNVSQVSRKLYIYEKCLLFIFILLVSILHYSFGWSRSLRPDLYSQYFEMCMQYFRGNSLFEL